MVTLMAYNYIQGTYDVQNKSKYVGTKNPRYLSSYELTVFKELDRNPHILSWGSETVIVPYFNPVKNKPARYMVDIYVKYQDKNGQIHEEICEIKPMAQSKAKAPVKGNKSQKTFVNESLTWLVNQAKWNAAAEYASKRNMKFRVLTEKSIFIG